MLDGDWFEIRFEATSCNINLLLRSIVPVCEKVIAASISSVYCCHNIFSWPSFAVFIPIECVFL